MSGPFRPPVWACTPPRVLQERGLRVMVMHPAMGVPLGAHDDLDRPSSVVVARKPIAVAAGPGQMGIHRNVIHPRFDNVCGRGGIRCSRSGSRAALRS